MITVRTTLPKTPVPPLVKIRDVAKLLSVSRQTVHNLVDNGALHGKSLNPRAKKRQHLRIRRSSLFTFYKKRFGHSLVCELVNPLES